MKKLGKVLVVTQHYPPDSSTTAAYLAAIAEGLAANDTVVVLSGSRSSAPQRSANPNSLEVIEIPNWSAPKDDLVRRAIAISLFALRMFFATLTRASRNDVVFCVTTPFTLPYAVVLAAKLRGAATALLIYDLYPEALEASGLIKPRSLTARLFRLVNGALFRALDAIITIGRDVKPLLLAYKGVGHEKIHFIPNWTLLPIGYREPAPGNRFRVGRDSQLIVGLSGNLGFTHSPRTIFEAARLLRDDKDVHLLLSGWGMGWKELGDLQATERLANVTLLERVSQDDLIEFLSAADVWIIPYRRNIAGVSIPSRMYNLMAVGRAIIVAAEPHAEASLVVNEDAIGWAVPPEDPVLLANAIRLAAADRAATLKMGRRAATTAEKYSQDIALARYREVILNAGHGPHPPDETRRRNLR
ncbi:glycosyltransferase family 4 protein [Bradyrhizobium sp. AUGA SZCCT0169]|uniref:glycosyltransferase family 4 protein n=1 Tax=Bradyrhizobium sp. AUGA SZCCT0169 TaxID=2807663 RepID=UPI001BAB0ED9|nr:glycosyltransferase family 4 protein [Bradyrhizobium sp. AUGA SZCCT0169]MBR1249292.1 glycosyltransferase family 4 protein [Bradyrhizobium sp. AUGA SZCCT0169]